MEQKTSSSSWPSVQESRQYRPKRVAHPANVYTVAEEAAHGNQRGRGRSMRSDGRGRGGVGTGGDRGSSRGVVGIGGGRGRRSDTDGGRGRGIWGIGPSSSWADIADNPTKESPPEVEEEAVIKEPIYSFKVKDLRPGTTVHTLTVKVINSTPISTVGALPVSECLVGDDSAVILFTARGSQVHVMKPETTVVLRNARVTVFRGSMRLSVDRLQLGTKNANRNTNPNPIQVVKLPLDHDFNVKTDNNISVIEFDVIPLDSLVYEQF